MPPTNWFASRSTRLVLRHSMVEDYRKHMGGLSAILEHDHDIAKLQAIANRRDEDLSRALVREMGNNEEVRKQVDACRREQVRHRQHTPLAERCATCMTAPLRSLPCTLQIIARKAIESLTSSVKQLRRENNTVWYGCAVHAAGLYMHWTAS